MINSWNVWPKISRSTTAPCYPEHLVKHSGVTLVQTPTKVCIFHIFMSMEQTSTRSKTLSSYQPRPTRRQGEVEALLLWPDTPSPPAKCSFQHPLETSNLHWCHKQLSTCFFLVCLCIDRKCEARQGRHWRNLSKGNQQRAMEHHKAHIHYLLLLTGCW